MSKTTSPVRIPDANDEALYLSNVSAVLPDAPPFSPGVRFLAPYKPFPGEDYAAFHARITMSMAGAAAANDPARPIWDPSKFESISADEPAEQTAMDTALANAFQRALPFARAGWDNPVAEAVLGKLAVLAPLTGLLPHTLDPNTAEFAWSGVRMLFAAGGHGMHAKTCRALESAPGFPWTADETEAAWNADVEAAHAAMGWPSSLAVVRWSDLDYLPVPADGALPRWVYWRAWIHVLTTLRYDMITGRLRMTHRGMLSTVEPNGLTSILGLQRMVLPALNHGLGCKSEVQKLAVAHALNRLSVANLLPARAMSKLPLTVLGGPWSRLVPDASVEGWSECHMRVTNAWLAGEGRVQADIADEEAVLDYAWDDAPMGESMLKSLVSYRAGVPSQYAAAWPADMLEAVFPNITDCGVADPNARKALIDVALVGDLLRGDCCAFEKDFPIFTVLPDMPSLLDSVNQGKSTFCTQYARAAVPGLMKELTYQDSNSAPDQRAIADDLRRNGTVCLGEFHIPRSNTAILSRAALASITTGGELPKGMVMSNVSDNITLSYSLYVSAKALDLTEDLLTRGIYIFLRALTPGERSAPGIWEALRTARLSILLRLGALAKIQEHGLAEQMNGLQHTTDGWRYASHRSLAMLIYQIRTGCTLDEAALAITTAVAENKARMAEHMRVADDQGVTASQQQSRDMRVTLEQMFSEVGSAEAKLMEQYIQGKPSVGRGSAAGVGVGGLARARMAVEGRQDQQLSVGFNQWTGIGAAVTDRMVSILIGNEVKKRIPENHAWRLPGMAGVDGWHLARMSNRADGQALVKMQLIP